MKTKILWGVFGVLLLFLFCPVVWPATSGLRMSAANKALYTSRTLGLALVAYASDHDGKFPEGKSSTEIFQALIDGKYINDPALLYLPMPGKIKSVSATQKLKPENVCWDVTGSLNSQSPAQVPLVYVTGYRVSYETAAAAFPLKASPSASPNMAQSWFDWWHGTYYPYGCMALCRKDKSAQSLVSLTDGELPYFIPDDFDPKGQTYHQLTPNGELPPE